MLPLVPTPLPTSRSSLARTSAVASALFGVALLGWLVYDFGWAVMAAQIRALGTILPGVLVLSGLKYPLQAAGWRLALAPSARPPWGAAISATIAGDAVGYLTWAGPFAGEPIKAVLSRDRVPIASGVAAGAAERGVYDLTAIGLVLVAWLLVANRTQRLLTSVTLTLLVVLSVAITRRRRQRRGHDGRPAIESEGHSRGMAAVGQAFRRLWYERRDSLPAIVGLGLAQHALLVAEAFLMLSALGAAPTWKTAVVFEGVTKIVNTVGTVVPGRLGVAEGGSALLGAALGFQASQGLGLALMRRVRALLWAGVGLVLLVGREAGVRRAQGAAIERRGCRASAARRGK